MFSLLQFIKDNFAHVAPIVAAGVFAIVITIDRLYALLIAYPMQNSDAFFEKIRNLIMTDRVGEAILLCERYRAKPLANVVREGLVRAHQPENLIEHGLQIAVGEQADRIQARTTFLSTIANVSTLLGLFGTILGLIQSFDAVGAANAQQRSTLLAQGISTAMNATMMGLGVAIPCMVIYSFLINRTNRLNAVVERSAVRTLDLLKQRYYKAAGTLEDAPHTYPGVSSQQAAAAARAGLNPHGSAKKAGS